MSDQISIGLANMHKEAGEVRAFLPDFVSDLENSGAKIYLEYDYGGGMSFTQEDYASVAPGVTFTSLQEIFQQDYVLVLRYPDDEAINWMRSGGCLISMVHYPTRPGRVALFQERNIVSISLDTITDDSGKRMIENLRSVGWNGVNTAFKALSNTYPDPGLFNPERLPIQVTLLGAGAVGIHVVQAAIQYGDPDLRSRMVSDEVPGVKVMVVDYDITPHKTLMSDILRSTDILVDATQRLDASQPVIPNSWIAYLPQHAIITDLAVDPYTLETDPPVVRGIEGIPQGNLDKYIFSPDDLDWEQTIPPYIPSKHRRTTVSCYSWPGISPKECMDHYGDQLKPFMRVLLKKGYKNLNPQSSFLERALYRASLKGWMEGHPG